MRSEFERRLCRVLEFAVEAVGRLAENGYTDANDSRVSFPPEKVIVEASLLAYIVSLADAGEDVQERLTALVQVLGPIARGSRTSLGMCLNPPRVWDYAQAHIYLTRMGCCDREFDLLLGKCIASSQAGQIERVPYRALEQIWLENLWLGRCPSQVPQRRHNVPRTTLHRPMNTLTAGRDELYAFTHALMYLSDFGVGRQRLPRDRKSILEDAEAGLARCLSDQDYDLAGELLFTWPLAGQPWTNDGILAFRVLAGLDDEYGYLPCSSNHKFCRAGLKSDEDKLQFVATSYHTVFVMGILCATIIRSEKYPTNFQPCRSALRDQANRILPFLDGLPRQDWQDRFDECSPDEQDSLAGMLVNMALWRKFTAQDYAGLFKVLKTAAELGLTDAPMPLQAAEVIDRLASLPSGFIKK